MEQRVIKHCLIEALDEQRHAWERSHRISLLEPLKSAIESTEVMSSARLRVNWGLLLNRMVAEQLQVSLNEREINHLLVTNKRLKRDLVDLVVDVELLNDAIEELFLLSLERPLVFNQLCQVDRRVKSVLLDQFKTSLLGSSALSELAHTSVVLSDVCHIEEVFPGKREIESLKHVVRRSLKQCLDLIISPLLDLLV